MSFQFDPRPPNPRDLDYAGRGRSEPQARRSRNRGVHELRPRRPLALRLQALLASRSLVAALRVQYIRVIRYLARQADE